MLAPTDFHIIDQYISGQQKYFAAGHTMSYDFRLAQLQKLRDMVLRYEAQILAALHHDLRKSSEEAYLTEIGIVLNEIKFHIKSLKSWMKRRKVDAPLMLFPSKSYIQYEPLGTVLITAPWNYPFQLLINPLIGAISAGCTAVIKPAPEAAATAGLLQEMITATFDPSYIAIIQGGKDVNTYIWNKTEFDLIFFTGSSKVGQVVYEAAAKRLTPVILELGGKSPTIVHHDAHIDLAAKRIAWGKCLNAGQTCIAPDHVYVHESVYDAFIDRLIKHITNMFGTNPSQSPYYPRIIHEAAMRRLIDYMKDGHIAFGGQWDMGDRYMAPTVLTQISENSPVMQTEIFGPILPVLPYHSLEDVIARIHARPTPLALYTFGRKETCYQLQRQIRAGGACINDVLMHVSNHHLPFGGVGNSGIGKYHGFSSFKAFSHAKGIVSTPTSIDLPAKYVPFKYFNWIKKLM